jgi:microcystin-dependent protein
MPDSFTPNLNFTLPEVGSSSDTWGTKNNANWTALDGLFKGSGKPNAIVETDGNSNIKGQGVTLDRADNVAALVNYYRNAKLRWWLGYESSPETGGNVASDFGLWRWDDIGTTLLGASIRVARATGQVTFETTPQVGTSAIYHAGNAATLVEPVGTVKMFAGNGDPPGGFFMVCDGRPISRTAYPVLFAAIGTFYGVGDGAATFNIPNCAERVIIGKSTARTLVPQYDATVLANVFGEGQHALSTAELAAHTHPIIDPKHHHGLSVTQGGYQAQSGGGGLQAIITGTATNTSDSATGITQAESAGGGGVHNNVQPSLVMNFIIRVQ